MTYNPFNPLKQPQNAAQAAPQGIVGVRKDVAEGVRTALGPYPQTDAPTEGRAVS
ncbi:hypothetical protein OG241_22265 [Streptomyces sp. NBC_01390]|uniref:hypothetical protein n=1 Tax=Streptomyces sp. NBC_01390 TaxID=2903850 RepID=UPI003249D7BE